MDFHSRFPFDLSRKRLHKASLQQQKRRKRNKETQIGMALEPVCVGLALSHASLIRSLPLATDHSPIASPYTLKVCFTTTHPSTQSLGQTCNLYIGGCPRKCCNASWPNFAHMGSPANLIITARTASKFCARHGTQRETNFDLDPIS